MVELALPSIGEAFSVAERVLDVHLVFSGR